MQSTFSSHSSETPETAPFPFFRLITQAMNGYTEMPWLTLIAIHDVWSTNCLTIVKGTGEKGIHLPWAGFQLNCN